MCVCLKVLSADEISGVCQWFNALGLAAGSIHSLSLPSGIVNMRICMHPWLKVSIVNSVPY